MPREVMIPPMDITAEELRDRLLRLPPKPQKKLIRERLASSRHNGRPAPISAKNKSR